MDHNQIFVALAQVPTMITVLIGLTINNSRIGDFNARINSMDGRMASIENRLTKLDTHFDLLRSKVVELDNRLTRIEAQRR